MHLSLAFLIAAAAPAGDAWQSFAPRDEIKPHFSRSETGGPTGGPCLIIQHDSRKGLQGAWSRKYEIEGGQHYQALAYSRTDGVVSPRSNVYVELLFHDAQGNLVIDEKTGLYSRPLYAAIVDSEHTGWTKHHSIFLAPQAATHATLQLHLRREPNGKVEWAEASLERTATPQPRKVRLAAANFLPRGKNGLENIQQCEKCFAEAAEKDVDLLVLGECITSVGNGLTAEQAAEPIPGPSTKMLGSLAKKHGLYIVTSLFEREDHLIYNTAVLLDPKGELVGKYRKMCPARDEYRTGIATGEEFPVFDTAIGKVGMMICFDVHMPEVARGIAANGAEIIAMPIMGGHPALARARAIENQVYLVTATYVLNDDWMQTGVWGLSGDLLSRAVEPNTVVVSEVDLSEPYIWRANMGYFRTRLRHERPDVPLPR